MRYMRIPQNKFWGWVVASMVLGLAIGLGVAFLNGVSATERIASLETRLAGGSIDSSAALAAAEARAVSAEASITALNEQVTQLTADLQTANAKLAGQEAGTATDTIAVVSRSISPSTVATAGAITLTAKVKGAPDKVTMRLYTASKSFDKTYTLKKTSTTGDTQTWSLKIAAPAVAGSYRYYATAIRGSTRVTIHGAAPKTLTVN